MKDLIEALNIFTKYGEPGFQCEHDVLIICGIDYEVISAKDMKRLDILSFFFSDEFDNFASFRFGSC